MSEQNKAIIRRFWDEVGNKGNLAVVDELLATDCVLHGFLGGEIRGPEGLKQYTSMTLAAFADLHVTVEDEITEGDKVVTRYSARGTHKGEIMGIPPTGKQVAWTGIVITRIAGGKVIEAWANIDRLGLMQQLGAIPSQ